MKGYISKQQLQNMQEEFSETKGVISEKGIYNYGKFYLLAANF